MAFSPVTTNRAPLWADWLTRMVRYRRGIDAPENRTRSAILAADVFVEPRVSTLSVVPSQESASAFQIMVVIVGFFFNVCHSFEIYTSGPSSRRPERLTPLQGTYTPPRTALGNQTEVRSRVRAICCSKNCEVTPCYVRSSRCPGGFATFPSWWVSLPLCPCPLQPSRRRRCPQPPQRRRHQPLRLDQAQLALNPPRQSLRTDSGAPTRGASVLELRYQQFKGSRIASTLRSDKV